MRVKGSASVGAQRQKLRVAILTTAFPRWPNDSRGPSMLETARALRDRDIAVRVVTLHGPGTRAHEDVEAIPVHRVRYFWPERFEQLQDMGGGLPAAWRSGLWARFRFLPLLAALFLAAVIHGREVDVIHAHWTLAGLAAWLASFITGTPFVLTLHGSDVYIAPGIPGVRSLTNAVLRGSAHVIAVSRDLAEAASGLGVRSGSIEVIPDGIDLDRFTPGTPQREPLLLFVGSLIERKGAHHLLRAMPAILGRHPNTRLAVVGEGPERSRLEALANELGLGDRVDFIGPQSQAQIALWMKRARLFVLPSQEEALGIVLLEALASGTPCVASRVGGIPDIVSPNVGVLVNPRDPIDLARGINSLLDDSDTWAELQSQARQHVERNCWTWKKVAVRLQEVFEDARARRPGRRPPAVVSGHAENSRN